MLFGGDAPSFLVVDFPGRTCVVGLSGNNFGGTMKNWEKSWSPIPAATVMPTALTSSVSSRVWLRVAGGSRSDPDSFGSSWIGSDLISDLFDDLD